MNVLVVVVNEVWSVDVDDVVLVVLNPGVENVVDVVISVVDVAYELVELALVVVDSIVELVDEYSVVDVSNKVDIVGSVVELYTEDVVFSVVEV